MAVMLKEVITEENVIFTMGKKLTILQERKEGFFSLSFFGKLLSNNPFRNPSFKLKLVIGLFILQFSSLSYADNTPALSDLFSPFN